MQGTQRAGARCPATHVSLVRCAAVDRQRVERRGRGRLQRFGPTDDDHEQLMDRLPSRGAASPHMIARTAGDAELKRCDPTSSHSEPLHNIASCRPHCRCRGGHRAACAPVASLTRGAACTWCSGRHGLGAVPRGVLLKRTAAKKCQTLSGVASRIHQTKTHRGLAEGRRSRVLSPPRPQTLLRRLQGVCDVVAPGLCVSRATVATSWCR